ncbi:MAG: hypothetical protein QM689_08380 [Oscillospiraceae bacterium]
MKKRFWITALTVFLAMVFCTSGALAAWQTGSDTKNNISVGSVKGEIIEEYDQGQTVLPGDTVSKVVNVKNTGTADAIVRVKINKIWGAGRDADGVLIPDETLDTSNIQIAFDTESWYYDESDGYYYYKGVLNPGELTAEPLLKSFTVTSGTDNAFAGKTADIRVAMECIQAGGDAVSTWGKELSDLGITYTKPAETTDTAVQFKNPTDGFRFDADGGDLFANFKNLIPGETVAQTVKISNDYDEPTDIYFYARFTESTDENKALVEKLLKDYAVITIADADGNVIYTGPVWGDAEGGISLKEPLFLKSFAPGDKENYTVTLSLAKETGNDYSNLLGSVDWIFTANGAQDTPNTSDVPSVQTGLNLSYGIYVLIMSLSGAAIVLLQILGKRKRAEEK